MTLFRRASHAYLVGRADAPCHGRVGGHNFWLAAELSVRPASHGSRSHAGCRFRAKTFLHSAQPIMGGAPAVKSLSSQALPCSSNSGSPEFSFSRSAPPAVCLFGTPRRAASISVGQGFSPSAANCKPLGLRASSASANAAGSTLPPSSDWFRPSFFFPFAR